MPQELLTLEQVAHELQMSIDTIRGYVREKKLPAIKLGREYRVRREDLTRFLENRRTDRGNE